MRKFTESELKDYAMMKGEEIVIRTYENGNSNDERRKAKSRESKIITAVIYGSLLALNRGADIKSVLDTAEFIGDLQLPEMNGYDTIYLPIRAWYNSNR